MIQIIIITRLRDGVPPSLSQDKNHPLTFHLQRRDQEYLQTLETVPLPFSFCLADVT